MLPEVFFQIAPNVGFYAVVKSMLKKIHKSLGVDGTRAKLVKYGGYQPPQAVLQVINVWNSQSIHDD